MKRCIWFLCAAFLAASCGEDPDVARTDARITDAAVKDAPLALTCQTSEPPHDSIHDAGVYEGPFLRCGARGNCSPPLCWWCTESPTGPEWSLEGDDGCTRPDARVQDAPSGG